MFEARDGAGNLVNQFFSTGQTVGGNPYFYSRDLLRSITELTNDAGTTVATYAYDPYGAVHFGGSVAASFQYAGYYVHTRSMLNFATFRSYNANLGRWINRDPIEESGGINFYEYASNAPIRLSDPLGLKCYVWVESGPFFSSWTHVHVGIGTPGDPNPGQFTYSLYPIATAPPGYNATQAENEDWPGGQIFVIKEVSDEECAKAKQAWHAESLKPQHWNPKDNCIAFAFNKYNSVPGTTVSASPFNQKRFPLTLTTSPNYGYLPGITEWP